MGTEKTEARTPDAEKQDQREGEVTYEALVAARTALAGGDEFTSEDDAIRMIESALENSTLWDNTAELSRLREQVAELDRENEAATERWTVRLGNAFRERDAALERVKVLEGQLADAREETKAAWESCDGKYPCRACDKCVDRAEARIKALEGERDALKERDTKLRALIADERVAELANRLVAPGPKAAHVSASEVGEVVDWICNVQRTALSTPPSPGDEKTRAREPERLPLSLREVAQYLSPGGKATLADWYARTDAMLIAKDTEAASLRDALERARADNSKMHRRAQKSEGAEMRLAALQARFAEALDEHFENARDRATWLRDLWRGRYRECVKLLVDAGVPDHVVEQPSGKPHPAMKTGYLDVLIRRVIEQRDEARAALSPKPAETPPVKVVNASHVPTSELATFIAAESPRAANPKCVAGCRSPWHDASDRLGPCIAAPAESAQPGPRTGDGTLDLLRAVVKEKQAFWRAKEGSGKQPLYDFPPYERLALAAAEVLCAVEDRLASHPSPAQPASAPEPEACVGWNNCEVRRPCPAHRCRTGHCACPEAEAAPDAEALKIQKALGLEKPPIKLSLPPPAQPASAPEPRCVSTCRIDWSNITVRCERPLHDDAKVGADKHWNSEHGYFKWYRDPPAAPAQPKPEERRERHTICVCDSKEPHYVPPSLGEPGFYVCEPAPTPSAPPSPEKRKHWPDCATNHGGAECDMGPDCGSDAPSPESDENMRESMMGRAQPSPEKREPGLYCAHCKAPIRLWEAADEWVHVSDGTLVRACKGATPSQSSGSAK